MSKNLDETMRFEGVKEEPQDIREIMQSVYQSLKEKGYKPINQIIGYLLSGDPTYITSHNDARKLIRRVEREEILEELLTNYINED